MPAWWTKKSSHKKKEETLTKSSSPSNKNSKEKCTSFESLSIADFYSKSPSNLKNLGVLSDGFSGFSCSDSDLAKGHPLPQPGSSTLVDLGVRFGSGSVSGSSVSSSGSSDDPVVAHDHHAQFGVISDHRGCRETKFNSGSRSPRPCSRSPGPSSRGTPTSMSPLRQRMGAMSLDSAGKNEEMKIPGHKLPLPPGSPTSPPSALHNTRCQTNGTAESTSCTLSKWKKGRLLGRGTFGHVYLGFNSHGGQMCAIKEVKVVADDHSSKECLKQLNQEIVLLSSLSHPNIVQYHGSEMGEEALSVYLEYVSGGSIHKLLQEYGPFKELVIRNYTRQIISGLAYLHGRNTVHRDIKGANILVDPSGEIKLADFGMAKHISSTSSFLSFKGSPYWMAPEVVMNTNGYSLAVDIWSLGCTILEMATSKPPWSTQYDGVAAIFKIGNSKDIPEIPDHLSNDAKNFVRLCLQRDPSARPTASQLLEHPFVRDQATTRAANTSITKDAFPYTFDGSRTPPILETHSGRSSGNYCEPDYYSTKSTVTVSRALKSPRDDTVRMMMSLPVSPCSSPLRNYGPAHKSCYLSSPHRNFALAGQVGFTFNDNPSILSTRPNPNPNYGLDPLNEFSLFQAHTANTSPRNRLHTPNGSPRHRPV